MGRQARTDCEKRRRKKKRERERETERERERERHTQTDRQTVRGGERETERNREKHVTWGYNIVAYRWTGASNPYPHPYTQASRPLVFPVFHSDGQTDNEMK